MDLKNIENLVDRLSERVEALLDERSRLKQEIDRLKAYAAEREQDCANLRLEMARAVEAAAEEARDTDRTNAEIVTKLEALNDRMVTLAELASKGELQAPEQPDLPQTEPDSDSANPEEPSQTDTTEPARDPSSGLLIGQIQVDPSRWDGGSRDTATR